MWLVFSSVFSPEKCGKIWKIQPFFQAATALLGKYRTGSYGRIGVLLQGAIRLSQTVVVTGGVGEIVGTIIT